MAKKASKIKKRGLSDLLSTGSTLLNLGCTGDPRGGFSKGLFFFIVGDSQSGKTFLSLTCFAEAALNPAFADYRLIFDDAENGALMNIERFFGKAVADRVEPPAIDKKGNPINSRFIEEFYGNLYDALHDKRPCIYVLDSMDALTSTSEEKKFKEKQAAILKGRDAKSGAPGQWVFKGDYGDGKAKINSRSLRSCVADLRDTGSILIIINQTRDNINAGMFDPKKIRSGGKSLTFYAHLELWSSLGPKIKKLVRGKQHVVGVTARVNIRKNRIAGKDRTVEVPIFYNYGIDDIRGCINFLVSNKQWNCSSSGLIDSGNDLGLEPMKEKKLIREIEKQGLEMDLRYVTADCWRAIEQELTDERKPRYQ